MKPDNLTDLHNLKMPKYVLKQVQNKKGQKFFQLHCFFNTFLQLAAEKKYSKNGGAGNFFDPSYFVTALALLSFRYQTYLFFQLKNLNQFNPNLKNFKTQLTLMYRRNAD